MSDRYSGFPATITIAAAPIHLRQLESHGFTPGGNKSFYTPGGSLDRQNATLHSARPVHRFATRDLDTIFANISPAIGATGDSAVWRYQQRQCNSGFATDPVHIARTSGPGFIKPVSLTAGEDDVDGALVSCEYHSTSVDGSSVAEDKTNAVDLSTAPQPTFVSQFFFGPVYENGVLVPGIDRFNCNFGINIDAKTFGNVYPKCYTIQSRNPSMVFTGTNAAIASANADQFINAVSGSGWNQYLRRGASNGSRVADNIASHAKITLASGEWCVDDESWQQTNDNQVSVTVEGIDATIGISLASAIP